MQDTSIMNAISVLLRTLSTLALSHQHNYDRNHLQIQVLLTGTLWLKGFIFSEVMPSLLNRWCYFHNSETCRNTQFVLAEVQKFVGVGGGCHFFFFLQPLRDKGHNQKGHRSLSSTPPHCCKNQKYIHKSNLTENVAIDMWLSIALHPLFKNIFRREHQRLPSLWFNFLVQKLVIIIFKPPQKETERRLV